MINLVWYFLWGLVTTWFVTKIKEHLGAEYAYRVLVGLIIILALTTVIMAIQGYETALIIIECFE